MSGWLCDTNLISELMRKRPNPNVISWAKEQDGFCVSSITCEEIYTGLRQKELVKKRIWFERFLAFHCSILTVDQEIAKLSGELRGQLLARGISRSQADSLIAATARQHKLTVVTRNTKDFEGSGVPVLNPFG